MADSDDERTALPQWAGRPSGTLAPGTLLNGIYRIDAQLGAGGMGEVYRATNIANDECDAVKVIGRALASQPMVEAMFRKEARVVGSIHSPAVARLKLFARDPTLDVLYFVTEYIAGPSLLDRLKQRPASGDELAVLLRRMATALVAVHEAGAVHRDLSPDNIILPGGDLARAKIIDFGIVKELDASQLTVLGAGFAGKFGYIAPEQLGFTGAQVGPWTDLYSLALVGIAFARGAPLGMGHTMGTAEERRREPIDLSAIPRELGPLFMRMLAYDWRERIGTAGEVLAMLDRAGSAQPAMGAAPPIPVVAAMAEPSRPPEWPGQGRDDVTHQGSVVPLSSGRRGVVIAGVAAILVLLLAGGFAMRAFWRPGAPAIGAAENLADATNNGADAIATPAAAPTGSAPTRAPTAVAAVPAPIAPLPVPRVTATPTPRVKATPRPGRTPTAYPVPPPVMIPVPVYAPRVSQGTGPKLLPGSYFSADDYPSSALRSEAQGTTRIQITVSPGGRPSDCAVISSSGNAALDATSCRVAMARMRFTPGKDDSGNPVASTYGKAITWRLPSD